MLVQTLLDGVKSKKRVVDPTIGTIEKFPALHKKLLALNKLVFGTEPLIVTERFSDYISRVDAATQPKFQMTAVGVSLPISYSINSLTVSSTVSYQRGLNTANPNAKLFKKASSGNGNIDSFLVSAGLTYSFDW